MAIKLLCLTMLCAASLVEVVHSQGACESITTGELGNSSTLTSTGIIADILSTSAQGGTNTVSVRILDMRVVCLVQHEMENRYRYTSVVVSFECLTTDARVPECLTGSPNRTEQFDLGCDQGGQWTPNIFTNSDRVRSINPTATLRTVLDTSCKLCINPSHPQAALFSPPVDNVTHCVSCAGCPMGLQRCYFNPSFTDEVCCNYFNQGACTTECPNQLVPGADNQCGCPELNDANGNFNYSNNQLVGSIATLSCNANSEVNGTNPVTCLANGEWTGKPICRDSTGAPPSPPICDTGCIVGIVVGIIVALILFIVVIIIGVFFGIKSRK